MHLTFGYIHSFISLCDVVMTIFIFLNKYQIFSYNTAFAKILCSKVLNYTYCYKVKLFTEYAITVKDSNVKPYSAIKTT